MNTILSAHRHLLILTSAATLLMSGCGKKADAESADWPSVEAAAASTASKDAKAGPLPRACTLLTIEEAQTVIGQSAGQMADDPENCMWASSEHPGRMTMLMVQVIRGGTPAETGTLYENLTGLSGNLNMAVNDELGKKTGKSGQEIEDLGDAAWCSASNADLIGAQQLVVRNGTIILSLNITGMTMGERQASLCPRLEAAGRTALGRLGGVS
ncbi:MAG: hypothetical protein V4673_00445 [Pseudomonadota bacterium]